jgi:hypothetical protein
VLGHDTPLKADWIAPVWFGLVTVAQLVPFHCCANDLVAKGVAYLPTAKQLVVLGHATDESWLSELPDGAPAIDQFVPFQCSTSV